MLCFYIPPTVLCFVCVMFFFLSFKVFSFLLTKKRDRGGCICFNCLPDILWLLVFCISSLWWPGLVCSVWLWYFLIVLTYVLPKMAQRTFWRCDMYNNSVLKRANSIGNLTSVGLLIEWGNVFAIQQMLPWLKGRMSIMTIGGYLYSLSY